MGHEKFKEVSNTTALDTQVSIIFHISSYKSSHLALEKAHCKHLKVTHQTSTVYTGHHSMNPLLHHAQLTVA